MTLPDQITDIQSKLQFFNDKTLRPEQSQVLEFFAKSKKKFIAIEAPTGVGKSAIGVIAGMMQQRSIYTVHSKNLQEQIASEFPSPEVEVLMGRGNYVCGHDADKMGDECTPNNMTPCNVLSCEYAKRKQACKEAKMKCFNYPYLFTEFNFAGAQFAGHDLIVCDEADTIEEGLSRFISLTITDKMLNEFKLTMPKYKAADGEHKVAEWKEWAVKSLIPVRAKMKQIEVDIDRCSNANDGWIEDDLSKESKRIRRIMSGLCMFRDNVDQSWLYEEVKSFKYGTSHKFCPVWLTEDLGKKFLWQYGNGWFLMSATLPERDVLCRELGIPPYELDYLKIDSPFPPENSPIYFTKSWTGVRAVFDIENAIKDIIKILNHHPNEKGIIHCVNYEIVKAVMNECQRDSRLMTHDSSNRNAVLKDFMASSDPKVMVSPSMDRGVSLPGDKCRFSIQAKAPFPNIGDKKVKRRRYDYKMGGEAWYKNATSRRIIQGVGRGVRSEDDWCVNYMLDKSAWNFVSSNPGLFNEYFKKCIKYEVPEWLR